MSELITPDGITETGKELLSKKLGGKYTPEQIKDIITTIDTESRRSLIDRGGWTKLADAFKRSLPFVDSTSEKMSNELALLFKKEIPTDVADMKLQLAAIIQKKY